MPRYLGKTRLAARWGLWEFAVFMGKVLLGAAAVAIGSLGWLIIISLLTGGMN